MSRTATSEANQHVRATCGISVGRKTSQSYELAALDGLANGQPTLVWRASGLKISTNRSAPSDKDVAGIAQLYGDGRPSPQ